MVTTLLIVRHAQTNGNLDRIFQGQIDRELSEAGEIQLKLLTERFRSVPIDAVCTSPLPRAKKTAAAITAVQPVPVALYDELMEINAGGFEGKRWDALPSLYPAEFEKWKDHLADFHAPGGESCAEVYERVSWAALSIAKEYAGKTVAVVSHGCAIKNLLCWASGKPLSCIAEIPWVENTAISRIDFDEAFEPYVVWMDDAKHLDGVELPKPVYWEGKK